MAWNQVNQHGEAKTGSSQDLLDKNAGVDPPQNFVVADFFHAQEHELS